MKLLNDFSALASEPLHPFEIAQLGTLECEDAEEAKRLVWDVAAEHQSYVPRLSK